MAGLVAAKGRGTRPQGSLLKEHWILMESIPPLTAKGPSLLSELQVAPQLSLGLGNLREPS
jgi:hypothetical protein